MVRDVSAMFVDTTTCGNENTGWEMIHPGRLERLERPETPVLHHTFEHSVIFVYDHQLLSVHTNTIFNINIGDMLKWLIHLFTGHREKQVQISALV